MITITKTLQPSVKLTAKEVARFKKMIIDNENVTNACTYARINYRTFTKAISGQTTIRVKQRDRLNTFCDLLQGKSAA